MIHKVLYSLAIYLTLMLIISSLSFLFAPIPEVKSEDFAENGLKAEEVPDLEKTEEQTIETTEAMAADITATSPFGFSIKITEENEEEQSLLHFYSSIGYLTSYNYVEEIEKRKTKFWYKRKFVLCFIKNRIKILKSKKWKLNILNKLS